MIELIKKYLEFFWKFISVSLISTLLDWGIFAILISLLVHYQLSVVISYSSGAILGFILNRFWTFKAKDRVVERASIYSVIVFSSLLITMALMKVMVDWLSIGKMLSRVIVTGTVFIYNFTMHKYVAFRKVR